MAVELPTVVAPEKLRELLHAPDLLVVDLSKPEVYRQGHIAGAVHLDYKQLVLGTLPAPGLLPPIGELVAALAAIGIDEHHRVVACDDEGGGKACRLLWTLDLLGHHAASVLDGGLHGWVDAGFPLDTAVPASVPSAYEPRFSAAALADKAYILEHLGQPDFALLDARTPAEFDGSKLRAARGGHIPGAVNLNWMDTMDRSHGLRLLPADTLHARLRELGLTPDKEIVTYCHTHHRSAHSYVMLKQLGYSRIRGYAGSWAEWGNDPDTPAER
jgi:thiosulfate/3-mercaptopyruvate sulfurtransferase